MSGRRHAACLRWPAAAAMAWALTGCAVTSIGERVTKARADLEASPPCCAKWDEVARQALPLAKTKYEIGATSQVFVVDGAKVYVTVLELPAFSKPYAVSITSHPLTGTDQMALLMPRVLMLDEGYQVRRNIPETGMRTRGSSVERTVFINPSNSAERYMVIYGSPVASSYVRDMQVLTSTQIATGPGAMMNWTDGKDVKVTVQSSPIGTFEIAVDGLTPPPR